MNKILKTYTQTEVITSDPLKLILLLYDACLKHLFKTRDAIEKGDIRARGEHLGKAIEIINELMNSLSDDTENEAVQFLYGLYMAIIRELGKVPVTNDRKTIELSIKYIAQLRHIWKEHVMKKEAQPGSFKSEMHLNPEVKSDLKKGHTVASRATYSSLGTYWGI